MGFKVTRIGRLAAAGGSSGWLGSETLIKVYPNDFVSGDTAFRGAPDVWQIEDDVSGKLSGKTSLNDVAYAFIPIPSNYVATIVKVYSSASKTSTSVTVFEYNQTTGGMSKLSYGNYNVNISLASGGGSITSSDTASLGIKVDLDGCTIYGADITILTSA